MEDCTAVMTAVVVRVWVGPVSPEGGEQQIAQSRGIEAQQPRQVQQPQPVRGQGHSDREEARQHPPVRGQQRVLPLRALLLESRQAVGQRPQLPAHAALQWQFISVG